MIYRISTAAIALFLCNHNTSTSAFAPTQFMSPSKTFRLHASLSDQLSQLSYDNAFVGKASRAVAKAASSAASTPPSVDKMAENTNANFALPDVSSLLPNINVDFPKLPSDLALDSLIHKIHLPDIPSDWVPTAASLESIDTFLHPIYSSISSTLPFLTKINAPPSLVVLLTAIATYSIISNLLTLGSSPPPSSPYPMNKYDPASARRYFDSRLFEVVMRGVQVTLLSGAFLSGLALDWVRGQLDVNAERRAEELSVLLTRLGPSFIKIGQSLSIRTDLLSPAYVRGLKTLQDQVPPFSTTEARQIIENELGSPINSIFVNFPSEPIAAASLGQVYRATVRNDDGSTREVAVKVQRPNIMNQIALDMHLIREVAPFLKRTFNFNTDLVGVVDTWGVGFVDELDYIEEAVNAKSFMGGIASTPLAGVVFSPPVLDELTTRKVLTTEWVVGERLDKSAKSDVSILCSIAMNTYLTMMLETGVLHCDPHPGNLLRTTDGRLCILDWGMVTRLEPDMQLTLIEHMAHLTSADYEEIPKDLLLLGFIPEDKSDLIKDSGVVDTLAEIYGAWTKGGGAAAVNVNKVIADLQDLTAEKGNLFQIPPYFAYIAKSFSVLEGIGLSNEPNYSIIKECLPYVSKRLLTDKSERTGGALSTFIFGPNKNNDDRIIDYDRVEQLVSGFGDYTTSASGELLGKNTSRAEAIENVATQILDLLATEEETPLQQIFIEQLAKIISASSRSVWSQLRERSGKLPSGRTLLGTLVDPLGLFRTSPIVRPSELDERTVETTRNLIRLLSDAESSPIDVSTLSNTEIVEISSIIVGKLWERRSGVLKTGNRLAMQLLQLTANKLEKGEREILVIPARTEGLASVDGRIRENAEKTTTKKGNADSDRLESARRILAMAEQG
eukprot:CCRYP_002904-RB/>CCRYP_002904-RB protein AED:0.21 eAED:0.21 QI:302/1/1/1/0.6/0.54/11/4191/900